MIMTMTRLEQVCADAGLDYETVLTALIAEARREDPDVELRDLLAGYNDPAIQAPGAAELRALLR